MPPLYGRAPRLHPTLEQECRKYLGGLAFVLSRRRDVGEELS